MLRTVIVIVVAIAAVVAIVVGFLVAARSPDQAGAAPSTSAPEPTPSKYTVQYEASAESASVVDFGPLHNLHPQQSFTSHWTATVTETGSDDAFTIQVDPQDFDHEHASCRITNNGVLISHKTGERGAFCSADPHDLAEPGRLPSLDPTPNEKR